MERMIAVAVRDRSHLFLWMRVRRAEGDIYYALPTGREEDPEWKKWNPHGSWHRDGRFQHKSFNRKLVKGQWQQPNAQFKGRHQVVSKGIASDEPLAFGVLCDPAKFSSVFEIPVTRENYIAAAWGDPLPEWTRELEAELPEELQDWSLFETVGDQI